MGEARACHTWDGYGKTGRILISPKRLGFTSDKAVSFEHGYVYPEPVKVLVKGDIFRVTEGEESVRRAADDGYAYVAATLSDAE